MNVDFERAPHPRYRLLARIGTGGMGEVFRTYDRLTAQVVALKRVHLALPIALAASPAADKGETSPLPATLAPWAGTRPDSDGGPALLTVLGQAQRTPSPALQALRVHLTQEFRTLASLRHPHIVSVLDYGFDRDRQPYFTMEFLEDAIPLDKAARGLPFAVQVGLLLQVLQALTYLHRRGVLHRDLKPGNILVASGPRGPQVKLLDFGLALLAQELRSRLADIAGTLGYIAPEVLVGAPPSEASDLFAVGVMAHEILLGAHPLGTHHTTAFIREFLDTAPIFSGDERLSAALSAVLHRALCRAPRDRYLDASVFGLELARAAGLPVPVETAAIRESFLQAATFIARDEELTTLKRALAEAAAGTGGVWLIGGESGVGKSRLIDELRTLALVRGTRVVRGQAVSTGGGYQVWQGALRPLCLDETLDEPDAGVLKSVVPDISKLLERPVPDPPELDPESAQTRFLIAAEKLLLSQCEPLVVLLEDLHWADPGSLALLARLMRSVAQRPLLIIGSYRHDERPELVRELPGAKSLKLPRLQRQETELLSASMLGEVGRRQDIVALLVRETGGNAFFIVEVVRALAEGVGTLGRIGTGSIPTHVAAGGVQAVLSRRLGRVPEAARPLLCAAAVFGKELDIAVLQALPEGVGEHIEEHIAACAAVAVLEVCENRWRFVHDKLRETLLGQLTAEARALWHLRLGEAIERTYAAELSSQAATLGYHFDQAGVPARALPYLLQAGDRATPRGSMHEAIAHLDRAVALFDRVAHTPSERAHALGLLCRAYHGAGKAEESTKILERMFADAGLRMPSSPWQFFTNTAGLVIHHLRFRLGGQPQRRLEPEQTALHAEAADAQVAILEALLEVRSPSQITYLTLALAAVGERLRDPARMAAGYAALGSTFANASMRRLSDSYFGQARKLLAQNPAPALDIQAFVELLISFACTCRGEWELSDRALAEDLAYRRRVGDWRHELLNVLQGAALMLWRGESAAGHASLRALEELAYRVDSAQFACWGQGLRAALALRAGQLDRAAQLVDEARENQARTADPVANALFWGISGLCALRRELPIEARRCADRALDILLAKPTLVYGQLVVLVAVTETYAVLWQKSRDANEKVALATRFRDALARFRILGALIPIGRPQAFLWHGRYAALHGQTRFAEWLFHRSQQASARYRMPFDEAHAHKALAELAQARGECATAAAERNKARLLFERLGAHWHCAQLSVLDP